MIGLEYILNIHNMQHIELAQLLGIKKQNINLWIKRKQDIPKKYLPILENIFGIDSIYFSKELDEIDKLIIQKEKLKKELNPVIERYEQQFKIGEENDFVDIPIYNKKELNEIEKEIEKAKLISRFKNALEIVEDNPYINTFKLIVELLEKSQHEIILHKTIEALAHYLDVLPDTVSTGEEQDEFEKDIFEVFDDHNF